MRVDAVRGWVRVGNQVFLGIAYKIRLCTVWVLTEIPGLHYLKENLGVASTLHRPK
jgi:hypothetical protein